MTGEQVTGMNYFSHQFLREEDFKTAQRYHVDRLRQHNRLLHTQGVVEGLVVQKVAGTKVRVTLGKAVDGEHREVELAEGMTALLAMPEHIDQNLTQPIRATADGLEIELKDIGGSGEVFIAITHNEQAGVPSTDPGIEGKPTRIIEGVRIIASTTRPTGASILLAQIQRNDDRTIKGDPVDQRSFATAHLGPKAVTGEQLADKAIRTNHISDQAVTGTQIADKTISAEKLETKLLQQIQSGGQVSGWMRLAFLPKKFGTEPKEFVHAITHSSSEADGAVGVMEIPVLPGVRRVTQIQIYGTTNEGEITLEFYRAGFNREDSILLFDQPQRITPTAGDFRPAFGITPTKQKLTPNIHGLALKVTASKTARIYLVAVEFAYTDE
ncbi:MAG: hypothetical protein DYG89_49020 [Caldilinea sp. CFX5]|nr:hypothetical protein [Caldilinea sp. CFX5]